MIVPNIRAYVDGEKHIAKVEMEVFENGKVTQKINFEKGKEYVIRPISSRTKKNVGREVRLLDFVRNKEGQPMAKVKYLDTKGEAKVPFDYLAEKD